MKNSLEERVALNSKGNEVSTISQFKNRNRPLYGQALVALMAHGALFCIGLTGGYSGILLPQLQSNSSDFQIDDNAASWIVSTYTGATSVGCFLSGVIMFFTGRRITLQIGIISLTIGWILIALSNSQHVMYIGRAMDGFGRGLIILAVLIHQDEMADPRLRASLVSVCLLTYSIGVLVITALGTTVGWRISAGISAGLSFLDFVGYCFVPESPVWLVRNGKIQKARDVFKWLWNGRHDEKAEADLEELLNRLQEETGERQVSWKDCLRPQYMKPFLIMHTLNLIQIFCGTYLVIFYASDIFSELIKGGDIDLNFALVFASATRVVAMVVTCFLLLWFGRRPLCVFSGAGAGLATLFIAVATTLNFYHAWLLFVLLSIYVALSTCGLFTVVPILSSEMIPSRIRGIAGGYIFTMDDIGLFIFTKAFPYILKDIGISGLFWIFSCSCFAFSLFLYLFMPETKNCTLVEIEKYFAQKNILWIHRKRTDSSIL